MGPYISKYISESPATIGDIYGTLLCINSEINKITLITFLVWKKQLF